MTLPLAVAIRALVLPQGPVRAAKALDRGAGLFDRIGTALALAGLLCLVSLLQSVALRRISGVQADAG